MGVTAHDPGVTGASSQCMLRQIGSRREHPSVLTTPGRGTVDLERRARIHHALGEAHRLAIVDVVRQTDVTVGDLAGATGLPSNLLAFHLDVLEDAGVLSRHTSEGDGRRRYVRLLPDIVEALGHVDDPFPQAATVLFVCTANSARSQLAAGLWAVHTGSPAVSAGTLPAERVHPMAIEVARTRGIDLHAAVPRHVDDVDSAEVDLVVSVCDRANEAGLTFDVPRLHWSVADPVGHGVDAFASALADLDARISHLAAAA